MAGVTGVTRVLMAAAVMAAAWTIDLAPAHACGGTFCSSGPLSAPVDQAAERVVFAVDAERGTTDMIVQVQYEGSAAEFAWIVPIANVPLEGTLDTFPQEGLDLLAASTAPVFQFSCSAQLVAASGDDPEVSAALPVDVHTREEVGPYDVAVVESDEPDALVEWLRTNGFRVSSAMEPFIAEYAELGMKFLALRLSSDAKVGDIAPLRLTLPGTSPSIPLRMTAIAAEPEMSLQVHILGPTRYAPANWPALTVDANELHGEADLTVDPFTVRWSWPKLIAAAVDEAGGQGWVTEAAFPVADLEATLASRPADEPGLAELRALIAGHGMVTRLATRVSPGEMTSDPIFRASIDGERPRLRMVDADCAEIGNPEPCDFASCGAFGTCATVDGADAPVAGCACLPGTTARTTMDPYGEAIVSCQDTRLSFVNPGDRETPEATPLPDPCVGFDCEAGTCVPMNGTPTCVCDAGFVAIGTMDPETRERTTRCVTPNAPIDPTFYEREGPGELTFFPAATSDGGCAAGGGGPAPMLGLLVGVLLLARRRR